MVKRSSAKPRVFVSSVVKSFTDYREAARRGILAGGGEPVLVNEDYPASGESSRNACLDAVETCDLIALVVGARGGWTAPSGQLVVEEEYHHARLHRIPVLVFLQDVERDADAERLVGAVSEYTRGTLHRKFLTPTELESVVAEAVHDAITVMKRPMNSSSAVTTRLADRARSRNEPLLRFVLVPERQEEVVTPMELESDDFLEAVQIIGHSQSVRLLSYRQGNSAKVDGDSLVLEQNDPTGRWDQTEFVQIRVSEGGVIQIDVSVTHRGDGSGILASSMVVLTSDLTATLERVMAFAASLYQRVDPHRRHQRFLYGVALLELGYRGIAREVTRGQGVTMSMRGNEPIAAFEDARELTRDDLEKPGKEIPRVVTMLERAGRA